MLVPHPFISLDSRLLHLGTWLLQWVTFQKGQFKCPKLNSFHLALYTNSGLMFQVSLCSIINGSRVCQPPELSPLHPSIIHPTIHPSIFPSFLRPFLLSFISIHFSYQKVSSLIYKMQSYILPHLPCANLTSLSASIVITVAQATDISLSHN